MKPLIVALLVVAISRQSVQQQYDECDYKQACYNFRYDLNGINSLMVQESNHHRFNLNVVQNSVYLRTQFILKSLNDKISTTYQQRSSSSGSNSGWGSSNTCKQLEDEILAKSKEFGIEKIGLEDKLTRLRKVLSYQDERKRFNDGLMQESDRKIQTCEQNTVKLERLNESLNSTNNKHLKKIKQQGEKIKSLETENKRLQAQIHANSPAIHGETGTIYGLNNVVTTTRKPAMRTTELYVPATESTGPLDTSNSLATVTEEGETTTIPDIDLRMKGS